MAKQVDESGFDFHKAEAMGQIKTAKAVPVAPEKVEEPSVIVESPVDFQNAIAQAQYAIMSGEGRAYVEVAAPLFKYLVKNQPTRYLTYGDPGVKVYLAGTKQEIDSEEKMSAEDAHSYNIKKAKQVRG